MSLLSGIGVVDADLADGALHARARLRARDDDAGARPRRAERRPVRAARRRDLRLDALPPGRRLDRRLALRRDLRQPARRRTSPPRCRRASGRPPAARPGARRRSCRPRVHAAYVEAFAASLRPVFLVAAGDLARRVPAHVAAARGAAAEERGGRRRRRELRDAARGRVAPASWSGSSRRSRGARTAGASTTGSPSAPGVDLDAAELWLLARLGEGRDVDLADPRLAAARAPRSATAACSRTAQLAHDGEAVYAHGAGGAHGRASPSCSRAGRRRSTTRCWAMLDRLARELVVEPPVAA